MQMRICRECNMEFPQSGKRVLCSETCRVAYRKKYGSAYYRENAEKIGRTTKQWFDNDKQRRRDNGEFLRECQHCQATFDREGMGARKYCSEECSQAAELLQAKSRRPSYLRQCIVCLDAFETRSPRTKCCSSECTKRNHVCTKTAYREAHPEQRRLWRKRENVRRVEQRAKARALEHVLAMTPEEFINFKIQHKEA